MATPKSINYSSSPSKRRMSNQIQAGSPIRQPSFKPDSVSGSFGGRSIQLGIPDGDSSFMGADSAQASLNPHPSSDRLFSGSINNAGPSNGDVPESVSGSQAPSIYSIDVGNPDPEVVRVVGRHLVREEDVSNPGESDDLPFDSLRLQGGDITRQLYKWQRDHESENVSRGRSKSFDMPRPSAAGPNGEPLDIQNIKVPGGFRRNFISAKAQAQPEVGPPTFLTRNFIEFLSIYGHFAGEELDEDDEEEDTDEGTTYGDEEQGPPTEETSLLGAQRKTKRPHHKHSAATTTTTKAVLLLLKSFLGTGVLFLPKAYLNGGLLFSSVVLLLAAALSYWCFILLIKSRMAVGVSSFGDIGEALYGNHMRQVILFSIVFSQIGFAAAYIVFTSENLQALILSLTEQKTFVKIESLIFLQLLIFLPLSMIRNIAKLSGTALIADFFILLGLVYLYYWGGLTIATHGVADIKLFNPKDWTLFIGTAIFTFEGIGLIIPIQESMRKPSQFGPALGGVIITVTLIFVSMGSISYAAYGSNVQTVVLLNLPQDSQFVSVVQGLYSLAILLSTPIQLFPAIRILENGLFSRSGKHNPKIKWQKNVFRFFLVFFTAFAAWGGADDLDRFVALIGSFACIPLVYVYPPLLHLKSVAKTPFEKISDIALASIGVTCMAYTTWGTLSSWISNP